MDTEFASRWTIVPHVGVGILRFGQTRSAVRSLLGTPSKVFKKVPFADTLTDAYGPLGIHLFYDLADRLESVDAFPPADIQFGGLLLLDVPIEGVLLAMKQRGYGHDSYVFEEAGFSLYALDGIVKSVTIFGKGCHDITDSNSQRSRALRAAENWRKARNSELDPG